jgi:hypothetical protein
MNKTNTSIALLAAALFIPAAANALTVTKVSQVTRPSGAEQISGITYAGGNLFYAVDDNDNKLYPLTLNISRSDGKLASSGISIGTGVAISGGNDTEGCAFDPASGNVWISQETSALIREYDPSTGTLLRSAPVPAIQKQYVGNYSLEALTISGDGYTMWTANEEALKVDGPLATNSVGSVIRLTRFTRSSVRDNWTPNGEWAYVTQPIGTAKDSNTRSGVAGLCALPDGTLLTLERRCYQGGLFPDFNIRVYQVNFSGATDVSSITALKNASYTATTKTLLWEYTHANNMPNYEGICLGPRLDDGSCVLVLISDAGSYAEEGVITLQLSGLNMRTLYVEGDANSEPIGGPYRYLNESAVSVTLPGGGSPYEASLRVHPTWTTSNHSSGQGSVATFSITADDTLRWSTTTNTGLPMLGADSFERIVVGTEAPELPGWSGDGVVTAESYTPALPPGYPLQDETHSQVLVVDGEAVRSYATVPGVGAMVDVMLRVTRETTDSPVEDAEGQVAVFFAEDGRATLQHKSANGSTRLRTPLSSRVFANNDWVRASLLFDYVNGPTGTAWCQVRLNGEPCVTDAGVQSPANPVSPGAWYRTLDNGAAGKVAQLALIGFGAVDDVALYDAAGDFEFDTSAGTSTNGVPYSWFNDQGLAWDPAHDMDGDTHTARDEYAAGTDPWDALDFLRILATDFDEEGRFRLYFNGEADASHYFVDEVEDLVNDTWSPATGYGQILQDHGTNVWTQATQPTGAAPQRFFRVRAVIPEE